MAHSHGSTQSHTHGVGVTITEESRKVLLNGLKQLLKLCDGLAFNPFTSERYPLPLCQAVYGKIPDPREPIQTVTDHMNSDPVGILEEALVLYELYACNQPELGASVADDDAFLSLTFSTKRLSGFLGIVGECDKSQVTETINSVCKFKLLDSNSRRTALYPLLNMAARYSFVYGQIDIGDGHAMSHFIEDYAPVLLISHGTMDDLDITLSLAAMKLGIPSVVPIDYPFSFGHQLRTESLNDVGRSLTVFPNIHRLIDIPGMAVLPEYLDPRYINEDFVTANRWGDTGESFFIVEKGKVDHPGQILISGEPQGPLGVVITADVEPLDAFDCKYIESFAARSLSKMHGVRSRVQEGTLVLELSEDTSISPERLGKAQIASIQREFPKIQNISVQIIFDTLELANRKAGISATLSARDSWIKSTTEETMESFYTCLSCSPFAPDHACILTPERPPQCGRSFEQIKTGALYGYDDMSNIHHRVQHSEVNSYGTALKGTCIDQKAGEWSGINETISRLTDGRTTRVQLHALDTAPHTGCSCFRLIMFQMEQPATGIGIMARDYKGTAPDGRTWRDLHYALTGKQTVGMAGANLTYLRSPKFLSAHGGWDAVVWVSETIAKFMGAELPPTISVGSSTDEPDNSN